MEPAAIIAVTRHWISSFVIGLNLCPFAQRPFLSGSIRYAVSPAQDGERLLSDLRSEIKILSESSPQEVETTLLIHPGVFADFLDYNDFLDDAEHLLASMGMEGVLQIASFHPQYQFADTEADDAENWTNRSPYPMLHLLREDSITQVSHDPEELAKIPQRNIETMQSLGKEKVIEMFERVRRSGDG